MKMRALMAYAGFVSAMSLMIIIVPPSQAYPTDKDQCKKSGWENFGIFQNQGDCVSYVVTDGRNAPANQ